MNRQTRILMLALALLALAGVYAYWALPTQQHVGDRRPTGKRASMEKPAVTTAGGLHLEQLQRSVPQFAGVRRDIFHFKVAPPPPPPPPKIVQPLPPPPPVAKPVSPPPPVAVTTVTAAHFNYLGRLNKQGKQLLFLASGKDIYLVAPGDQFGDQKQFLLKSADDDQVVIEQKDLNRPIVINLAEQQSATTLPNQPAGLGRPQQHPATGVVPTSPPALHLPPGSAPPSTRGIPNFRRYRP